MHHIVRTPSTPRARLTTRQRIVVMVIFVLLITTFQYIAWGIDNRVELLCYAPLGLAAAFTVVYGYRYALLWIVILAIVRAVSLDTPDMSLLISPLVHLLSISAFALAWNRAGLRTTIRDARDTVTMVFLLMAGAALHVMLVYLFTRFQYLPAAVPGSPVPFLMVIVAGTIYVTPVTIMVLLPALNKWLGVAPPGPAFSIRSMIPKRPLLLRVVQVLMTGLALYLLTLPETYTYRAVGLVLIPVTWITLQDGLSAGMLSALVMNLGITIIWQAGLVPGDALFSLRMQLVQVSLLAILVGALVKESHEAQQAFRDRTRLMEAIQDAIITTNNDGIITSWNAGAQRLYGWSAAETVGHPFRDVIRPFEEIKQTTERDSILLRTGYMDDICTQMTAHGKPVRVSMQMATSRVDNDRQGGMIAISRDIGDMLQTQESLQESEAQYRELFLSAQRATQELELLGRVRTAIAGELELKELSRPVCEAIADVFGYTLVSLYMLEGEDLVLQHQIGYDRPINVLPRGEGVIHRAVRTGKYELIPDISKVPDFISTQDNLQSEVVVPLFDRDRVVGALNIETHKGVILDENDLRIARALGQQISVAISRGRLYSEVRESEVRYRSLIENSSDMVTLFDDSGVMTYNSPSVARIRGLEPGMLEGQIIGTFVHPDDQPHLMELILRVRAMPTGSTIYSDHMRVQKGDGSYAWVEGSITNLLDVPAVRAMVFNYRDVTERRIAAQAETDERAFSLELADMAAALNSTLDKDEIYHLLAESIEHLLPAEAIAILEMNEPPGATIMHYRDSQPGPRLKDLLGPDQSLRRLRFAWQSYESQCVVRLDDSHEQDEFKHIYSRSLLALPILSQGEVMAMVMVGSHEPGLYNDIHEKRLQAMVNQTAIALQKSRLFREVEAYASDLQTRVEERTAELSEANQRLTELSQLRDEFVSNVSHELRTPITSIKLYHTLLSRNPTKQSEYIDRLERETRRLEALVEDLLYLSRLDQNRLTFRPQTIAVAPLIQTMVNDRELLAETRSIALAYQPGNAEQTHIDGDPRLIEQCVSVLLTNALNYTPPGGHVTVRIKTCEREGVPSLEIAVVDDGPGISTADQARIFERFFRGEAGLTTNTYGTGLGLSIAREIAELMGGDLQVQSVENQGSTFTLWMPVADPPVVTKPANLDWPG